MGAWANLKHFLRQKSGENPDQVEKYGLMALDQSGDVTDASPGGRYPEAPGPRDLPKGTDPRG